MKFEITNYEQFATQTALAFGLSNPQQSEGWPMNIQCDCEIVDGLHYVFYANFEDSTLCFAVKLWNPDFKVVSLVVWPDGTLEGTEGRCEDEKCRELLVKGLFHLGLLTPEVERALEVNISAHEKLEWRIEYEARNGL